MMDQVGSVVVRTRGGGIAWAGVVMAGEGDPNAIAEWRRRMRYVSAGYAIASSSEGSKAVGPSTAEGNKKPSHFHPPPLRL